MRDAEIITPITADITQVLQDLKDEGKNFTHLHLIELLNIIAKNNIVKRSDEDDILHPHHSMTNQIHFFFAV